MGIDSVKADKLGYMPIKPELDRIAALKTGGRGAGRNRPAHPAGRARPHRSAREPGR
ncbi:MAG: hypothetical protein WKG07_14220 [Hymenobacter sp.]